MLDAVRELAKIGGDSTLQYFGKNLKVESKDDDSPVTAADRNAEKLMRGWLADKFPEHGIIGEEYGVTNPDSNYQWVLDPIDGTRSFIHGIPLYTTLVGLMFKNKPVAGAIYAPVMNQLCSAAYGTGAFLNDEKVQVSECKDLSDAVFLTTDIQHILEFGHDKALAEMMKTVKMHRTWGDAYGHMMVASGRADIMFDPVLSIWDAAALQPIMEEAGGVFADIDGVKSIHSGNGFSTNENLLPGLVDLFRKEQD